jgi:WD40 repeat protein
MEEPEEYEQHDPMDESPEGYP